MDVLRVSVHWPTTNKFKWNTKNNSSGGDDSSGGQIDCRARHTTEIYINYLKSISTCMENVLRNSNEWINIVRYRKPLLTCWKAIFVRFHRFIINRNRNACRALRRKSGIDRKHDTHQKWCICMHWNLAQNRRCAQFHCKIIIFHWLHEEEIKKNCRRRHHEAKSVYFTLLGA